MAKKQAEQEIKMLLTKANEMRKEIESLRQRLVTAETVSQIGDEAVKTLMAERTELERRMNMMWYWMRNWMGHGYGRTSDRFIDDHKEAAEWFEEE